MTKKFGTKRSNTGFTLLEMMVSLTIVSIISGIAVVQMREFERKSYSAASELTAVLKRARSKAITSVTTFTVRPISDSQVTTSSGPTCAGAQSSDSTLTYRLPTKTKLLDTTWSICYSNRGVSSSSSTISILDLTKQETKSVQVVLGGGVRVL